MAKQDKTREGESRAIRKDDKTLLDPLMILLYLSFAVGKVHGKGMGMQVRSSPSLLTGDILTVSSGEGKGSSSTGRSWFFCVPCWRQDTKLTPRAYVRSGILSLG